MALVAVVAVFKPFVNHPVTGAREPQAMTADVVYRVLGS